MRDCTENLARFLAISLYHPATVYIIQPRVRDSTAGPELRSFEGVQGPDPVLCGRLLQCSQLPYSSRLLSQRPVTCGQVAEIWVSLSVKSDGGFTGKRIILRGRIHSSWMGTVPVSLKWGLAPPKNYRHGARKHWWFPYHVVGWSPSLFHLPPHRSRLSQFMHGQAGNDSMVSYNSGFVRAQRPIITCQLSTFSHPSHPG